MVFGVMNETNTTAGRPTGKEGLSPQDLVAAEKESHDIILKTFRLLISDLCQQFKGGHPG